MQLSTYLENSNLSDAKFAEIIDVDRSSVSRMRRGLHIPNRDVMQRIFDATNGAVTANDFFGIPAPASDAPSQDAAA